MKLWKTPKALIYKALRVVGVLTELLKSLFGLCGRIVDKSVFVFSLSFCTSFLRDFEEKNSRRFYQQKIPQAFFELFCGQLISLSSSDKFSTAECRILSTGKNCPKSQTPPDFGAFLIFHPATGYQQLINRAFAC